jgi:hypothetical protein
MRAISAAPLLIVAISAVAQTPSALPVEIQVHFAPEIVSGSDGSSYIAYELDMTNVDSRERTLTLNEATVSDTQRASPPLATFAGADWKLMRAASSLPAKDADAAAIPPATHALFSYGSKCLLPDQCRRSSSMHSPSGSQALSEHARCNAARCG